MPEAAQILCGVQKNKKNFGNNGSSERERRSSEERRSSSTAAVLLHIVFVPLLVPLQ